MIYNMEQWETDGTFNAKPGQQVSEEIYNRMLNGAPPKTLAGQEAHIAQKELGVPISAGFLMGEPHSTDTSGKNLYLAFGMVRQGKQSDYYYLGLRHAVH